MTEIDVARLASLAHLEMSADELKEMEKDLASILAAAEALNEVNTDGVEPLHHAVDLTNRMREDIQERSLMQEDALANGPQVIKGYFRVPRILGDS